MTLMHDKMAELRNLEAELQEHFKDDTISFTNEVPGGIVNKSALFSSGRTDNRYFVKYNAGDMSMRLFDSERASLQLLEGTSCVRVPESFKVFGCKSMAGAAHVLEYMSDLTPLRDYWAEFGQQIGKLHSYNSRLLRKAAAGEHSVHVKGDGNQMDKFGGQHEYFIGTFSPGPGWKNSWPELFIGHILQPIVLGVVEKYRDTALQEAWSWLQLHLHKVFDKVPITPALCHGDLCLANFGQTNNGPVLFDPSVLYAHNLYDLILSQVEGKFDDRFFEEYHRLVPRGPLWKECMLVYEFFNYVIMLYHEDEEKWRTSMHATTGPLKDMLKTVCRAE